MTILEAFIYDPTLELKEKTQQRVAQLAEPAQSRNQQQQQQQSKQQQQQQSKQRQDKQEKQTEGEKQHQQVRQRQEGAEMWGGGRTAAGRKAVENIKRKVRGLMPNESIPLSVEGHVDVLIKQAVDPKNLAAMYIGWMSFW